MRLGPELSPHHFLLIMGSGALKVSPNSHYLSEEPQAAPTRPPWSPGQTAGLRPVCQVHAKVSSRLEKVATAAGGLAFSVLGW